MRILYIHQYFCTPRGRMGTRSYAQARAMQKAGHEVIMLTSSACLRADEVPDGDGVVRRGVIDGIACIVLAVPYHQTMGYAHRVLSYLRFMLLCCRIVLTQPRIDCVYATSTPLSIGVPPLVGKLARGIPYVFEVRDLWPDAPFEMGILKPGLIMTMLKTAERMFYRHARFLVAVNEDVGRCMLRTLGRPKQLIVAPNACDGDLFHPDRDGQWFRDKHGLADKVVCVHPGAMGHVNGLDGLLDAAAVMRDDTHVQFLLIGDGHQRPRLVQRIADEKLDNVRVLDLMPKEKLADVLAAVDIGLMSVAPLPVLEFNCANKLFDYLASGLPIALNYHGWQGRMLGRHGAGLSARQGDLDGFVAAIRRLAGDKALRAKVGSAGRKLAETSLSRAEVVAPIIAALDQLEATLTSRT